MRSSKKFLIGSIMFVPSDYHGEQEKQGGPHRGIQNLTGREGLLPQQIFEVIKNASTRVCDCKIDRKASGNLKN